MCIGGCSSAKNENDSPKFQIALGYIEKNRYLSEEIEQIFKKYLPSEYTQDFLYLKSNDIDFEKKEVNWSIGLGGTAFALKEMHEKINFEPFLVEKGCNQSVQYISRKNISSDLKNIKKILIYNNDYPSPLAFTMLYHLDLDKVKIFQTSEESAASSALKNGVVDVIVTEDYYLYNETASREESIIKIIDYPVVIKQFPEIKIPCKILFSTNKLKGDDRVKISKILTTAPWRVAGKSKLGGFVEIDKIKFEKLMNYFDWDLDNLIRSKILNLSLN